MRYRARLLPMLSLVLFAAGCSSDPRDASKLTLKNSSWDRISVQVVVTKSSDCDNRGPDVVSTQEFTLRKDTNKTILAPNGASVCWRHDRNPASPKPGEWSGWARAILFPNEDTETEI